MGLLRSCKVAVLLGLVVSPDVALAAPQLPEGLVARQPKGSVARQAANATTGCGTVTILVAQQRSFNPQAVPSVPASVAINCLRSVPNKPEPAVKLITSLKAYVQWQSTHAWLKDPPAGYTLPAVDIIAGLDNISATAMAGQFGSEYDFQASIVRLLASAHDGHFAYRGDVFKPFTFRNDLAADLVSVSVDGIQVPKLYHNAALNGTAANSTGPVSGNGAMPPAITKINGQDAATLIQDQGLQFVNFQDQDSQWNAQFMSYAALDGRPVISASTLYQGDVLTLEYDNGLVVENEGVAQLRAGVNFTNINSGEDFYSVFCTPGAAAESGNMISGMTPSSPNTTALPPVPPQLPGFPIPAIRDSGANVTAGYFLTGAGYEDVAVLSVIGFSPESDEFDVLEYLTNFQKVVGDFLAMSQSAGKQKLVIDLSANGGGAVIAGYDLYAQIFPNQPEFQAHNLRLTDSLTKMAKMTEARQNEIQGLDLNTLNMNSSTRDIALAILQTSPVVNNLIPAGGVFKPDGQAFANSDELIAPVTLRGDRFTAYQDTPLNETDSEFNLTGTGNRANPPPAVFAAENIVLLTDGTCGSTCTLFSYLMIMQNNVKTVVAGGRPQLGPMQSIAGVEGAQVFELNDLQQAAEALVFLATPEEQAALNGTELAVLAEGYALERAATPAQAGAVNAKNAFSAADPQTPLQFLYQAANCRFFYTAEMIMGPEATWRRAVDATFNDQQRFCVSGSVMPAMGPVAPAAEFFEAANARPEAEVVTASAGSSVLAAAGRHDLAMWFAGLVGGMVFLA